MNSRVDLKWLRKQFLDRVGMTQFEAGHLICRSLIAGHLTGIAPFATRYPKMSARSHLAAGDGPKRDFVIPSRLWKYIQIDRGLDDPYFNFQTDYSTWTMHKIEIDSVSAHQFLRLQDPLMQESDHAASTPSMVSLKSIGKGGRPPKYDWGKCRAEALRWMIQHGRPNKLNKLFEYMDQWYGDGGPGETELNKQLRPVYHSFRIVRPAD